MIDSLIANPNGFCDDLCNQIILYSSTVSKELGMSYGELWIGIMGGVFLLFIWYNILLLFSIYSPYKKTIKWLFWVSNIIIFSVLFITIGDFGVYCTFDLYKQN